MTRRSPWTTPWVLALLLLCVIAHCALGKSLPRDQTTGEQITTNIKTQQSEPLQQSDNNLESVHSNTTKENPIRILAQNLSKLYNAVQSFVSPWFESSEPEEKSTTTKPMEGTDGPEPEFDDFEDPGSEHEEGESEARPAKIDTDLLRYIRDVVLAPREGSLVSTLVRHARDLIHGNHSASPIINTLLRNEGNATSLATREGNLVTTLVRHARDLAHGNHSASGIINTLLKSRNSTSLVKSLLRHARDVAEGRQNLFQGYYDFIINEYSYKFWAIYMLFAAGLLTYSAIAAIYFSKFNTSAIDYELYDDFARSDHGAPSRPSNGTNPIGLVGSLVSVRTFQQIMDAISSTKFS